MAIPMWLLLAAAQESETGFSSPFEVNFGLFFWTWVVFIILFFVLKRFAWPAILKATEERERKIAHQLSEAERLNAEALLEEHRKLLAGARHDAHQLLQDAKAAGEKEREQILARTRQEQEQVLERARKEVQAERDRAITELRREAVDLSLAAASRLIGERLSAQADRKLVEAYLHSIEEQL
jgi:F-type H+-transporting ATPase subunit b